MKINLKKLKPAILYCMKKKYKNHKLRKFKRKKLNIFIFRKENKKREKIQKNKTNNNNNKKTRRKILIMS